MPHSACKSTFSDLRYLTFTRFFDGTPRVRAPAAPRLISQLFPLFHLLPSWRQYLFSFVCESTHKIATFREDLVTADDNGTNIRGNWANYCLPVGSNQACPLRVSTAPCREEKKWPFGNTTQLDYVQRCDEKTCWSVQGNTETDLDDRGRFCAFAGPPWLPRPSR